MLSIRFSRKSKVSKVLSRSSVLFVSRRIFSVFSRVVTGTTSRRCVGKSKTKLDHSRNSRGQEECFNISQHHVTRPRKAIRRSAAYFARVSMTTTTTPPYPIPMYNEELFRAWTCCSKSPRMSYTKPSRDSDLWCVLHDFVLDNPPTRLGAKKCTAHITSGT